MTRSCRVVAVAVGMVMQVRSRLFLAYFFRSDTQKSVIMELLAACDNRDAGSIYFCFTPYAASHTFA